MVLYLQNSSLISILSYFGVKPCIQVYMYTGQPTSMHHGGASKRDIVEMRQIWRGCTKGSWYKGTPPIGTFARGGDDQNVSNKYKKHLESV